MSQPDAGARKTRALAGLCACRANYSSGFRFSNVYHELT